VSEGVRGRGRRRLAAILVAGYGRLFPGDEKEHFAGLRSFLTEIIEPLIPEFGGNIFKHTGELALIEFDSVVEAARCAAAMRDAVAQMNQMLPSERRIAMRIGINLGDIIAEGGDIFGDGVNIAARVGALAEPGSIYVSGIVHDQVVDRVDFDFEDLGPRELKNIRRPIHVYRMGGERAEEAEEPEDLGAAGAVPAASPAGFDDRRAIAVLPFANFSGDPEQEFFADGITEDIITMLAGWRAFPVIARASTFTYKGQPVDIKKVGEELGVRYVVEGSVRKSGRRVRVTAQLIQADTGHHIMAERYDRDLTDLFELQDEITHAIAGAIEPELLKFERERIAERPQHSEDAYELYQRGVWHHHRYTKDDHREAQRLFRAALAIDPDYPQAAAALALVLCNAAFLNWSDDPQRCYEESYELAQRAVALDARYPQAHFVLGLISLWTSRSDRAIAAFREAIKLNPSFAAPHIPLAQAFSYKGQAKEAISLVEKAIRFSPTDPRMFISVNALAHAHYELHHYQEAVEIGRRSWTLNRNWPNGLRYVVAGLGQLGHIEEAQAAVAELKKLDRSLAYVKGLYTRLYEYPGGLDHFLDGLRKAGFE
jgi:adenylate cyclase